jgi:hypothetical protein
LGSIVPRVVAVLVPSIELAEDRLGRAALR